MRKNILFYFVSILLILFLVGCEKQPVETAVITSTITPAATPSITPTIAPTTVPTITPTIIPDITPTVAPTIIPNTIDSEDTLVDNIPIPEFMPVPPFSYYISDTADKQDTSPLQLSTISSEANKITDITDWFSNNELALSPDPNDFYTSQDGAETTPTIFWDSNYIYQIDGANGKEGNILCISDAATDRLLYTLDFSNYLYSPEYKQEDYDYIQQQIRWASIKDNILYVSHSHWTYAESSNNRNAYITAIDLTDMSVIWRSDALVCNSKNFVIIDDVIISGYGFTDEPDFLYQINRNTGKVIDKTPLKTAPDYLIKKDSVLYVRTYNTDYQFTIE